MSQKNKNKSLVFEEEYDQNKDLNLKSFRSKGENSLFDSIDMKSSKDKNIIIRVSGEDYVLEKENCGILNNYLKEIKSIYDPKVNIILKLIYF